MPRFHVTATIYSTWSAIIEADDHDAARDIIYKECKPDIGPDESIHMSSRELYDAEV